MTKAGSFSKILKNNNTKAGMFYFVGNLFNKAIAFLTIPIFTRMLSTGEYGIYTTYSSWVSILAVVVGLSLGNTIRNACVDYKENLDEYIYSITVLSVLSFAVFLLLGVAAGAMLSISMVLIIFCILQAYMSNLISSYAIKYMMEVKYLKRMLLLALPNAISMLVSLPIIYFLKTDRYMGRIIVEVLVYLVMGSIILLLILKKGRMRLSVKYWRYALPLAVPLIFHGISMNLLSNSDRTMITYFRGKEETGVYGLIYSISMVAAVITSAMDNIWIPWFTNRMVENEKSKINYVGKYYIRFTLLLFCGLMLIAPEILFLMADEEYWVGKNILSPLILANFFIFLYTISVHVEYYYKQTKHIAMNTLIAGLLNIGLNFIFVPQYGAEAAAYTTLISYMVSYAIHYAVAKKIDRELFPLELYITPIAVALVILVVTQIFIEKWIIRWGIGIVLLVMSGLWMAIEKNRKDRNKGKE